VFVSPKLGFRHSMNFVRFPELNFLFRKPSQGKFSFLFLVRVNDGVGWTKGSRICWLLGKLYGKYWVYFDSSLNRRCKNMLRKFGDGIIRLFLSKSWDSGIGSNCWAAPFIIALTRSIAAGNGSSSEMIWDFRLSKSVRNLVGC